MNSSNGVLFAWIYIQYLYKNLYKHLFFLNIDKTTISDLIKIYGFFVSRLRSSRAGAAQIQPAGLLIQWPPCRGLPAFSVHPVRGNPSHLNPPANVSERHTVKEFHVDSYLLFKWQNPCEKFWTHERFDLYVVVNGIWKEHPFFKSRPILILFWTYNIRRYRFM